MTALPVPAAVEILEGCSPGEIPARVFASDVPLLLKGLVAGWPAVAACRPSLAAAARYLSGFAIEQPVTVYVGEPGIDGRFFYTDDFKGFNFRSGTAHLGQVLQKLAEQEGSAAAAAIYVGSTPVDRWLPGFRTQNDVALPARDALASFWLGGRTRISAHFDFPDNLACVVAGRRRFTLFPPDQVGNLYVGPLDKTPSGQAISLVDFSRPDLARHPRFAEALAAAQVADMEPGDALFVPSMWWHHVESMASFNLLVNYWWCTSPPAMGAPTTALMHAILSVRDLPARQKAAWRALFDHYVFDAGESVYAHIPQAGRGCLAPLDDNSARQLRAELLNRLNR
jgi:Cupin-like domain